MKNVIVAILLALFAVLITGCAEERECRDDWQCGDNEECDGVYGECIPKEPEPECRSNFDCDDREGYWGMCVGNECRYEEESSGHACCTIFREHGCEDGFPSPSGRRFEDPECLSGYAEYVPREDQPMCPAKDGFPEFRPYESQCVCSHSCDEPDPECSSKAWAGQVVCAPLSPDRNP